MEEAVAPDTAGACGRTRANSGAVRTQPSLPVNANMLSLEPLMLVRGKRGSCSVLAQITEDVQMTGSCGYVILVRASQS